MPRSGSFILGIKWKSQGLKPLCIAIWMQGAIIRNIWMTKY